MASTNYGIDRYIRGVDLDHDETQIAIEEDAGVDAQVFTTAKLHSSGTERYFVHKDSGGVNTDQSLFEQLETEINDAANINTGYEIVAQTPDGSDLTNSGIALKTTDDSPVEFRILWGDSTTTIDPRLLGWPQEQNTASDYSNVSSPTTQVDSPLSYFGTFMPPRSAYDKRRLPHSSNARSDGTHRAKVLTWDYIRRRRIQYSAIRGAHIWEDRADDATLAAEAGLPTGDTHNAFFHLWDWARSGERFFAVYDEGDQDLSVETHPNEELRLFRKEDRQQFMSMLEDREGGEKYWLRFQVEVDPDQDTNLYAH